MDDPKTMDLLDALYQAHNAIHQGKVEEAHSILHRAIDIDPAQEESTKKFSFIYGFDQAFRTACRKHGVTAAYVAKMEQKGDAMGMLAGGDPVIADAVKIALGNTFRQKR